MLERKGMPFHLGVFDVQNLQFDKLPLQFADVSGAANLVDIDRDFDLALLQLPFVAIPFEQSLLGAYCAETKCQIEPRLLASQSPAPFAVGFGQVLGLSFMAWDHRLVIMEKGQREPLVNWLCTVALHDPRSQHLYRIRKQDGLIPDVLEYAKHTQQVEFGVVPMPMLVVESTLGSYYFVHKQKVGLTFPKLIYDRTTVNDLDRFLARLRQGESDLYGVKHVEVLPSSPSGTDLLPRRDDEEAP